MLERTKIASPLSRKATLVAVAISQWTARKLDRKVTNEVNQAHNASADAGRYNKLLIEAKRLEQINKIVSKARTLHYTMTKPWCDEGMRILPNVLHGKFADEFRVLKREFAQAADDFCRDYPSFVAERKAKLNGLFDEKDYPSAETIREKFKLETKTFPVPDADDFRSDVLDADTIDDIKREIGETSDAVLDDAMKDTAAQIIKVVGHMSEKLAAYQSKTGERTWFADTLVGNVRELADLLPAFNLTNDPALDQLAKRIQSELCAEEPATLRKNSTVRESVKASADSILKDVESLLG
ncbi:MAG TPA: hypothetical protein VGG61_04970 [Gemmataceae bacterium]|jgi:hypothetical protein